MSGTRSALIVATDAYEDPKLQKLRAPAEDAEALAHVLRDPKIGDFEVTFSINAKEYKLRRTISSFFADRSPEDVLLLHFGCHGLKDDDGHLYFAASDTEFAHLDATAVPADFVNRRMNESRSKRIVLFLDCCYSGAFASGMTARAGETVEIRERFEGTGRVVLTASNAMEYSFEGENRHGRGHESVFTAALVQGLRSGEADRDQDRWISVDELYDYVFEHVRETTPHQTPGKWSFVQGDVYIARSSYVAPVERLDLPPELRSMESSVLPSTREQLVAELQRLISTRPQFAEAAQESLVRLRDDDSRRVSAAAERALATANEGHSMQQVTPATDPSGLTPREQTSTSAPQSTKADRRGAPARLQQTPPATKLQQTHRPAGPTQSPAPAGPKQTPPAGKVQQTPSPAAPTQTPAPGGAKQTPPAGKLWQTASLARPEQTPPAAALKKTRPPVALKKTALSKAVAAFEAHQATIALVCGVFTVFTLGVSGVIAIVLGIRAYKQIAADPDKSGAGRALAAIVLAAVGFAAILALAITA